VCSKCGQLHTLEEFRESHFCRECGRLLTYKDRVETNDIPKAKAEAPPSTSGFLSLFPYEPYPEQLEFMKDAESTLREGRVIIAEACNGFGKTACALAAALSLGRKIVYATRTHEQVRQVLHEVQQINKRVEGEYSAVALASRQNLCLNDACRALPTFEAVEACRVLRQTHRCRYRTKFIFSLLDLPSVLTTRRLILYGKKRNICPYFLSREAAKDSIVVVAPYQYIFNEAIRLKVGLEIEGKILIFDEAHNADKIGQEVLSDTLSERGLRNAERELETLGYSSDIIESLLGYLEECVSEKPMLKSGSDLHEELERHLGDELSLIVDFYGPVVDEIREYKISRGQVPVCYLNGLLNFLSLIESSVRESYVAIYRRSKSGFRMIEYRCLDPSLAVKPVIETAHSALIMSGTLSPLDYFAEILGLEDAECRTYSAIARPENVRAYVDTSISTRFQERNEETLRIYGERIAKLAKNVPNGILVFFPQRALMQQALKVWLRNGFIKKRGSLLFLGKKRIFEEGQTAGENARIVNEYKKATKTEDGAVLLAVFRGRNSEGSNFPHEEARGIFNIGLPYADYKDPIVKAQIDYLNKKRPRLGNLWYIMDAFRAANQALGRGIRHRDDWCHFYLMDRRYASYLRFISRWAVENGVEEISLD
jgi:Rad3-related DNA helicase